MEPDQAHELLASIDDGRLVIICGAGLSMAPPSLAPSAADLARECARSFSIRTGGVTPAATEGDLEKLVEFFFISPATRAQFSGQLVDWPRFNGRPNGGHAALADFLACGATQTVVSANFDLFVEVAAKQLGEPDFRAALDGDEMTRQHKHRPFLKLHGCMSRNRDAIVWCRSQVEGPSQDANLARRIELSRDWLRANLRGRDIVFVGFWTDWAYLNIVLEKVLEGAQPALVYLVDPKTENELRQKAPGLWTLTHSGNVTFCHVPQSGTEFLEELRRRLSIVFFGRLLNDSLLEFESLTNGGQPPQPYNLPHNLDAEELYDLRRDICGVPPDHVVRHATPQDFMHGAGAAHLMLQKLGLDFIGARYNHPNGYKIRIVNGAGHVLSLIRSKFSKGQSNTAGKEVVICASTEDDGNAKTNIVRGDMTADVVRSGSESNWLTFQKAREQGLC